MCGRDKGKAGSRADEGTKNPRGGVGGGKEALEGATDGRKGQQAAGMEGESELIRKVADKGRSRHVGNENPHRSGEATCSLLWSPA